MQLSAECMLCMMKNQLKNVEKLPDEKKKAAYLKGVSRIIAEADPDFAAPILVSKMFHLYRELIGPIDDFEAEKKRFNDAMLCQEGALQSTVEAAADPLLAALKLSRAGNYVDFSIVEGVSEAGLFETLRGATKSAFDPIEYAHFKEELAAARRFLLLLDNCGEVVTDKLLVKTIAKLFPDLLVSCLARSFPISNDATVEDAKYVGLNLVATVIGNGSDIAGTKPGLLSPEAEEALYGADVILSKGQGNFETLSGSGLNVYYAFLCKCDWFVERFGMEKMAGMFVNERRFPTALRGCEI